MSNEDEQQHSPLPEQIALFKAQAEGRARLTSRPKRPNSPLSRCVNLKREAKHDEKPSA
jgi:hypothetical protein